MTIELARAFGLNRGRQALAPNTSATEPNRGALASNGRFVATDAAPGAARRLLATALTALAFFLAASSPATASAAALTYSGAQCSTFTGWPEAGSYCGNLYDGTFGGIQSYGGRNFATLIIRPDVGYSSDGWLWGQHDTDVSLSTLLVGTTEYSLKLAVIDSIGLLSWALSTFQGIGTDAYNYPIWIGDYTGGATEQLCSGYDGSAGADALMLRGACGVGFAPAGTLAGYAFLGELTVIGSGGGDVPEPGLLALFLAGGLGLVAVRRRSRVRPAC